MANAAALLTPLVRPLDTLRGIYPGWWIVFTGVLNGMISAGSTGYVFSILVATMQDELGWSRSLLYGAMSVATVVASIGAGIVGPFFDRYGPRFMMTCSTLVSGIAILLIGTVNEPWQYYLLIGGVLGFGRAFTNLGPRTAIANWFIKKRPGAFATFTVGAPLSGVVFVPLAAWMLTFTDWRFIWVFMGVLTMLIVTPMSWIFMRRRPEDVGLLPDGEPVAGREGMPAQERAPIAMQERPEDRWTRGQALRTPTFWLVALGFMCTMFAGSGMLVHLAPYGLDHGYTAAASALILTSYSVGCVVARMVWPFIVVRQGIRRAMIAFAFSYAVVMASFVMAQDLMQMYVTVFFVGVAAGATMPLQGQVWADYFGRRIVGAVTGYASVVMMPSITLAGFSGALIHDLTGSYQITFTTMVALSLLASGLFFLARRPTPPEPAL